MLGDDDRIGRLLSRREALGLLGAAGAAWLVADTPASASLRPTDCVARPEQTEGPYFVEERLRRSDIRSDPSDGAVKSGVPLALTLFVSRLGGGSCRPIEGAHVDVWQCDASGVYSDARDRSFNTLGQKFLRGYQVTDAEGAVRFVTIYPGWYPGRTVHVHFKIRTDPASERGYEFTSQLYFDDALTDRVHSRAPYAQRGARRTRNRDDGIFRRGGDQLMLDPAEADGGWAASFAVALQVP